MELDENKRFLLALLYLFTHPANSDNDLERYIKDFALYCVIYDLIIKGILDYDYSPKIVLWRGAYSFMNISQEALADLEFLIAEDLVKKIKFSTAEHLYITGYCISPKGIKLVENDLKNYLDRLKNALNCDGTVYDLVVNDEDVYYLCEKEGKKKKIPLGCKETEDVSYESTPQLV